MASEEELTFAELSTEDLETKFAEFKQKLSELMTNIMIENGQENLNISISMIAASRQIRNIIHTMESITNILESR